MSPVPVGRRTIVTRRSQRRGICRVEGCARVDHAKGLCSTHYQRWWKTGATGDAAIRPKRASTCTVESCEKRHDALGYCTQHYYRLTTYGTAALEPDWQPPSEAHHHDAHPNWAGDEITYQGAHSRIERDRGRVRDTSCERCGNPAAHWTLRHDAASRRTDPHTGIAYSSDPLEYDPLCNPCRRLTESELDGQPALPGLEVEP